MVRIYREQGLLEAQLMNADAPYVIPHDKVISYIAQHRVFTFIS